MDIIIHGMKLLYRLVSTKKGTMWRGYQDPNFNSHYC